MREQGILNNDDKSLEPQHRREIPKAAIRRITPKMEGELHVERPKSAERPLFPLLRTKNEAL